MEKHGILGFDRTEKDGDIRVIFSWEVKYTSHERK